MFAVTGYIWLKQWKCECSTAFSWFYMQTILQIILRNGPKRCMYVCACVHLPVFYLSLVPYIILTVFKVNKGTDIAFAKAVMLNRHKGLLWSIISDNNKPFQEFKEPAKTIQAGWDHSTFVGHGTFTCFNICIFSSKSRLEQTACCIQ